jgi:hypothetical protein
VVDEQFNVWWDTDDMLPANPYTDDTPIWWAWEGWCAGRRAEREACAVLCDGIMRENQWTPPFICAQEIRRRSRT